MLKTSIRTIDPFRGAIHDCVMTMSRKLISKESPYLILQPESESLRCRVLTQEEDETVPQAQVIVTSKKWGRDTTITLNLVMYGLYGWLVDCVATVAYGKTYPWMGLRGKALQRRIKPILTDKHGALIPMKYDITSIRSRNE